MRTVLFICTGNVFRSMTAEYALRRELGDDSDFRISSAGTADYPHVILPDVREYLLLQGLDVRTHVRRRLTAALLAESDLTIAMDTEHQAFVQAEFGVRLPLYMSMCCPECSVVRLPDVDEAVPNYREDIERAARHIHATIDLILEAIPHLADKLKQMYLRE
jgi:protein-tyrosine phosphatase